MQFPQWKSFYILKNLYILSKSFDLLIELQIMYDQNQVSISRTATKVQFRYCYCFSHVPLLMGIWVLKSLQFNTHLKEIKKKIFNIGSKFFLGSPLLWKKYPTLSRSLEFFLWNVVSVLVSDLNQNSCFGRTLIANAKEKSTSWNR